MAGNLAKNNKKIYMARAGFLLTGAGGGGGGAWALSSTQLGPRIDSTHVQLSTGQRMKSIIQMQFTVFKTS